MGQHRALRVTGRAAGVEQPRIVAGRGRCRPKIGRHRRKHRAIRLAVDIDDVARLRQTSLDIGEQHRSCAIVDDIGQFLRMQLGIDRRHRQPSEPGAEQDLEIFRAIGHEDADPRARRKALVAQGLAERRAALQKLRIAMDRRAAETDRRAIRKRFRRIGEYHGDIHGLLPRSDGARASLPERLANILLTDLSDRAARQAVPEIPDFGAFTLPSFALHSAMISSELVLEPCLSSMTALTASPHFSSGTPITAQSCTAGWPQMTCSISLG